MGSVIEKLNKLTIGHFVYVLAAGAAAGFLLVVLDRYLITPAESAIGVVAAGPVI
jgi:hypothetical protein